MITNETLFSREFNEMMSGRRNIGNSVRLSDLPLPKVDVPKIGEAKGHFAYVQGVDEKFFDTLNNTYVKLVGRTSLKKRIVLSDGTFKKTPDGKYDYLDVTVPNTHVAVVSKKSIKLRRFIEVDGVKKEHVVAQGYMYVDYVKQGDSMSFIYLLPKSVVYRVNLCALVVAKTPRRQYYSGTKVALQDGTYIYLYVMPYKYRISGDMMVIGLKPSSDFGKELKQVLSRLFKAGYVFHPTLTKLDGGINGVKNLGFANYEGTILDDFEPLGARLDVDKSPLVGSEDYSYDV